MDVIGEPKVNELDRIANYIKKLKFKKAVVGGIEQESAYQAMRDLVSMFTEIYTAETERSGQMEARLQELQQVQSNVDYKVQGLKEQAANRIEKLKADYEARQRKLEEENATLKEQLKKEGDSYSGELVLIQDENIQLKDQLQAAAEEKEQLSARLAELNEQVAENDFQHETLEEIYLDANRRRNEILEAANAQADVLRQNAENENEEAKQRFIADMEAWKAQFDEEKARIEGEHEAEIAEYEADLAEKRRQAEVEEAEAKEHCEALIREAEQQAQDIIANAQADGARTVAEAEEAAERSRIETESLVASAQAKYKTERSKYDVMIRRLGELRGDIMRNIQKDVNQLQTLAFHLSGSSIESDTDNLTGTDELNELQKELEEG
ncbi:MAG: hypothetical protein IKT99_07800 [Oscillospiraceae bacterium]|nr:hypothetical protein [Oscillospiraceae bacterium]